jgi:5-methylcytosine-specific restriction endonuclease McrA
MVYLINAKIVKMITKTLKKLKNIARNIIKIRKRDNFECQYCGLTEEQEIKKYNRVLCVHHIDYNKENCKESNLISFCLDCHSKTNGDKKLDRDYWFVYCTYIIQNKLRV